MSETLRPLFDRVLVKRETPPDTTADGLFNPSAAKDQPNRGVVLSTGPGLPLENGEVRTMSVKAGDKVLFGKYDGQEIKVNGEDGHIVFAEREILAIIEQGA